MSENQTKITGVNKHSIVLDPCCGSGSFLVRAMTQALDDCATAAEQNTVKKHQIFGIEFDENVYGLATTNMLIHSDGNSNIRQGSCFALADWIKEAKPNVILMNPHITVSAFTCRNLMFLHGPKIKKKIRQKDCSLLNL